VDWPVVGLGDQPAPRQVPDACPDASVDMLSSRAPAALAAAETTREAVKGYESTRCSVVYLTMIEWGLPRRKMLLQPQDLSGLPHSVRPPAATQPG
jgi:hypothetical protein